MSTGPMLSALPRNTAYPDNVPTFYGSLDEDVAIFHMKTIRASSPQPSDNGQGEVDEYERTKLIKRNQVSFIENFVDYEPAWHDMDF